MHLRRRQGRGSHFHAALLDTDTNVRHILENLEELRAALALRIGLKHRHVNRLGTSGPSRLLDLDSLNRSNNRHRSEFFAEGTKTGEEDDPAGECRQRS